MLRHTSIILYACAWATTAHALPFSTDATDATDDAITMSRIDSTDVGALGISVDALAFFKDNEFDGDVVRGYSLPGFRMAPRLTYTPLKQIHLEAGFHATVFDGANKYPAYAFHDIAHWKGDQYQRGAHVLPFFRAVAEPNPRIAVVLGDLYGGTAHGLSQPLYNPELTLTDDPEMGAQIIARLRHWRSDMWINWQSYIYEEDTHQEAFTVGWSQRVVLPKGFSIPVQLTVQHRGGEQDIPDLHLGVQTISNGAVGVAYSWRPNTENTLETTKRRIVTGIDCEALALGAYQQSGNLWPFDFGSAAWAGVTVEFIRDLRVKAGAFHAPNEFCSLYGSPFFGTVSLKQPDTYFGKMTTGYWGVEYGRTFHLNIKKCRGAYTIGAKADGYINRGLAPFSFGVYFQASPSFILTRFGK